MTDVLVPGWRVIVASDEALVAETVRAALTTLGFVAVVVPLDPLAEHAAAAAATEAASVGLLITGLASYSGIVAARRLVARFDVPWAVVAGTPRGPTWGALLDGGAVVVVDSGVAIHEVAALLASVVRGTQVGDAVLEDELRRTWRAFEVERAAVTTRLATLTPRELTVLRSLYVGQSVPDIAAGHDSTETAVQAQIEMVLAKLDLGEQLAVLERLGGLLALDPSDDSPG